MAAALWARVERMRKFKLQPLASWASASLLSLLVLGGGAQAGMDPSGVCFNCGLLGFSASQALQLENQLLQQDLRPKPDFVVNYTGGVLPNSFQRPWSLGAAQIDTYRWVYDQSRQAKTLQMAPFNPYFTTSFYDQNQGFLWNSPEAPWNRVAMAWGLPSGRFPIRTDGLPGSWASEFSYPTLAPLVPTPGAPGEAPVGVEVGIVASGDSGAPVASGS